MLTSNRRHLRPSRDICSVALGLCLLLGPQTILVAQEENLPATPPRALSELPQRPNRRAMPIIAPNARQHTDPTRRLDFQDRDQLLRLLRDFPENFETVRNYACLQFHPEANCYNLASQFCLDFRRLPRGESLRRAVGDEGFFAVHTAAYDTVPITRLNVIAEANALRRGNLPVDYGLLVREELAEINELDEILNNPDREWPIARVERVQTALAQARTRLINFRLGPLNQAPDGFHPAGAEKLEIEEEFQRELALAVWTNDPNFQRVQAQYREIQAAAMRWAENNPQLSRTQRRAMAERAERLVLRPPGYSNESEQFCSDQFPNAFYEPNGHFVEICPAILFHSHLQFSLAHEFAHAMGISCEAHEFLQNQVSLQSALTTFTQATCSGAPRSCADWREFRAGIPRAAMAIRDFESEFLPLHQCLENREHDRFGVRRPFSREPIRSLARVSISSIIGELSSIGILSTLTSSVLFLRHGTPYENPDFLRACNFDPYQTGGNAKISRLITRVVAEEYRCREEIRDPEERLRIAIESARELMIPVQEELIAMGEGRIYRWSTLQMAGHHQGTEEQYADLVGGQIFAEYARTQPQARARNLFLFGQIPFSCAHASNEQLLNPGRIEVERLFSTKQHSSVEERRRQYMTPEIQSLLGCRVNYEVNTCGLGAGDNRAPAESGR